MNTTTERQGVAALEMFFATQGWFFREQFVQDWGIDAHVEIVRNGKPTGELIALQIKSGKSYFAGEDDESVPFKTDEQHMKYWTEHSIPIVVVIYNPDTKQMYWQHISTKTAVCTGKGWKIVVPKAHSFDEPKKVLHLLSKILQPEPYIRRLNKLRIDRRWMERIEEGEHVLVKFDDWVNKSLPRYQLTLSCNTESESLPMTYIPGVDIQGMLEHLLPWADFSMDEDAYRMGLDDDWFDEESVPTEIVPVSGNGETESYSLVLSLNDVGQSFLTTDAFLNDAPDHDLRTFTVDDLLA